MAALLAALFGSIAALTLLGIGVLTAAVGTDVWDIFDLETHQAEALQDRWRELRGADFTVTRYAPTEPAWDGGGPAISVLTLSDSHGESIWDVSSFTLDGGETERHAREEVEDQSLTLPRDLACAPTVTRETASEYSDEMQLCHSSATNEYVVFERLQ